MKKIRKIQTLLQPVVERKRVAAYARVSRESEEMLHSFSAQVDYYTTLIQNNPDWEFAGVYADYGISGTGTAKREQFNKLFKDAQDGKIDIILTKSIQRFARNTVDLLNTVRKLKELGVEVRFEKERINTFSKDGELMLSLLASFAQEESRSISENVKWGIRKRFQEGIPHNTSDVLGYKWVDGIPQIVPEQAEIVRQIFQNFLDGKSRVQSAKELNAAGIPTRLGNEWDEMAIRDILTNPIYRGDLLLQKTYRENHLTHRKMRNKGNLPQYLVQENHEAIIDPKTFDWVQEEMERRKQKGVFCKNPSTFTKKIQCGKCGCYLIHLSSRKSWGCNSRGVLGKSCGNHEVPEAKIIDFCNNALGIDIFDPELFEQKVDHMVANADFSFEVHLKSRLVKTYYWKQTGRYDRWTAEERKRHKASQVKAARKGEGRYCEFSCRVFGAGSDHSLRRYIKPCKSEPSGKRVYWRGEGISIRERQLKDVIKDLLQMEEYDPAMVIQKIDRIEVSKESISAQLFTGETLCHER